MKILAIETSSNACSAAVLAGRDGALRVTRRMQEMQRGHAEALMGMVEDVMSGSGIAYTELDRIAVCTGPGSFTGTRVGISAARGMALAVGAEAIGFSSFEILAAMACDADVERRSEVAVAISAGRGEIYFQRFDGAGEAISAGVATTPAQAAALLADSTVTMVGNAGAQIAHEMARLRTQGSEVLVSAIVLPDAEALAHLARARAGSGAKPQPLYLRAADAKPQTRSTIQRQAR